jgi:VanZ family protein
MWPYGWIALGWLALIFLGGASPFGRAGTQRLIDRLQGWPQLHAVLDRHHGAIRAAWHYVEFGTLSLLIYLIPHLEWGKGTYTWWAAAAAIPICSLIAYLDEKRQELTPGRQFRMEDFKHSIRGLVGMQVVIALTALVRWWSRLQ